MHRLCLSLSVSVAFAAVVTFPIASPWNFELEQALLSRHALHHCPHGKLRATHHGEEEGKEEGTGVVR